MSAVMDEIDVADLKEEIAGLKEDLAEAEEEKRKLEELIPPGDVVDAVDTLLDLVDRPTGSLRATLPQTPAAERALIHLFDALGRNL